MATQSPTPLNWASVGLLGLIWGGTFMVVSIALEGYPPITVACARTSLGAVAMLALVFALRRPWPRLTGKMVGLTSLVGILNTAMPFTLLSWGQQYVPSAFAGIAMAAVPIFILPLAHVFSDERLSARNMAGVSLGFMGAVVLIGPSVLALGSGSEPLGQLACLAATVCYAVSSIMTRRIPPVDPVVLAALLLIVGSIPMIPAMLLIDGLPQISSTRSAWALVFLGLIPTGFAALLRVMTVRTAGSVFMSLVSYQVPLWSMIFGVLVLNEVLPLRFFLALGLILCGVLISQWNSLKRIWTR